MKVGEAVGRIIAALGARKVFGVVGSGNFHVTNGLVAGGAEFIAARHEGGAASMADAYARMSGDVGILSVHPGCGLTNAMTGIGEAAKSRTPMIVLSGEATDPASNFFVDQPALARAVGGESHRIRSALTVVQDVRRAYSCALHERRTVLLNLPLEVQETEIDEGSLDFSPLTAPVQPQASETAIVDLADTIRKARRPVFIAGRGSRSQAARAALVDLADDCGALLAVGAVAKGLFRNHPWSIDVSGGFSSPLTAELIADADLIIGWGSALNMWTTQHGNLISPKATLVQVDLEPAALGRNRPVDLGIIGDVAQTAAAVSRRLRAEGDRREGYRSAELKGRIACSVKWRDVPYDDLSDGSVIDPRTLSIALDDLLPANRVIGVDSGNFMGYPSMYLSVPDENSFAFTQAFQSIGLGLGTAIGAAVAKPDRFPVAACGDGGFLMSISELETAKRMGLGMVIVVYNDHAYGAEVYHFQPDGYPVDTVTFPDTDISSLAQGYGCHGITVRALEDLDAVGDLLAEPLDRPLVIDAKITSNGSWWLHEAMSNH